MTGVPHWMASMPPREAARAARCFVRRCLSEATQARCDGYDSAPWYRGASAWLRIAREVERAL